MTTLKRRWFATVMMLAIGCLAPHCASAQQRSIDIAMQLTKTSALLGEPVWVDVSVTNRTKQALRIDMGDACFGNRPLLIAILQAEPGTGEHRLCGMAGGDCQTPFPSVVDPGKSVSQRYVLAGDFRITHPGVYHVLLEKKVTYATALPGDELTPLPRNASEESAKQTIVLEVRRADPPRLLDIEESLAREVNEPNQIPAPAVVNLSPSDMDALRKADAALRDLDYANYLAKVSIAEGLSDYPAAGMEPIFDDWLAADRGFGWYGLHGLYRLNTAESRRLLAQAAEPSKDVYRRWRQHLVASEAETQREFATWRGMAVRALVDMGDRSYLPLVEKLSDDTAPDVRLQAILGLGLLGGEAELPRLAALVRQPATISDRGVAFQAIGYTATLQAVPLLISWFTQPGMDQPATSDDALMSLTRHSLPPAKQRTIAEYQALWTDWWQHHKADARAYGPFDCTGPSFPWL